MRATENEWSFDYYVQLDWCANIRILFQLFGPHAATHSKGACTVGSCLCML